MLTQSCEMLPRALEEMVWLPEVQSSAYSHQTNVLIESGQAFARTLAIHLLPKVATPLQAEPALLSDSLLSRHEIAALAAKPRWQRFQPAV
jgi:hypothetical protein